MYCNQCGANLPDNAKFCQACGSAVGAEPSSPVAENPCPEDMAVTTEESRPKRKLSPRLKKLLAVLGGVAVVILAAVLIVSAVREHKRTTIIGEIPDPEAFFALSGEHEYWEFACYEHWITFETDTITQDMVDTYVELLCSDQYPFVLDETIPFSDGMVRYVFLYNGSEELYDAYSRQIMVEYSPYAVSPHTKVEISNSKNFELVPVEPYTSDSVSYESTEPAYAPDPEFFFNTGAAEKGDNSMTLVLSGTPGVAVYEYISVLKDSYGMTEVDSYAEAETWRWRLQKGANESATVSVGLDKRGDGDWDLSFLFGENVTLLQAETQSGGDGIPKSEPTPTPEPEPAPAPEAEPGSPRAPDPDTYFGTVDGMGSNKYWTAHFSDNPAEAINNYLYALRDNYGMTLIYSNDGDGYQQRSMQKGDDEYAYVSLELDAADDGTWFLWIKYGEPVELVQAEVWDQPLTEVVYIPELEPAASDPAVLPDFLEHDASGSFRLDTTSSVNIVAFLSDNASVRYVTEDYVQLLLDMGYYISDTEEKSYLYRWYLTHDDVGGGAIQGSAQVCVKHMTYTTFDKTKTEVSITFGSGVTYAGDSKTGSDDDFYATCPACLGSKECSFCDGSDTTKNFQAGIGWVTQNCTFCSGGRCPTCGGTGKP